LSSLSLSSARPPDRRLDKQSSSRRRANQQWLTSNWHHNQNRTLDSRRFLCLSLSLLSLPLPLPLLLLPFYCLSFRLFRLEFTLQNCFTLHFVT
jgi:hypothetical protein